MENFPNLKREKVTQVQQVERLLNNRIPKRLSARHIIIKMAKLKGKEIILKAAREKREVTYKGAPIRLTTEFSMRNAKNIPSNENQRPSTKTALPSKALS